MKEIEEKRAEPGDTTYELFKHFPLKDGDEYAYFVTGPDGFNGRIITSEEFAGLNENEVGKWLKIFKTVVELYKRKPKLSKEDISITTK